MRTMLCPGTQDPSFIQRVVKMKISSPTHLLCWAHQKMAHVSAVINFTKWWMVELIFCHQHCITEHFGPGLEEGFFFFFWLLLGFFFFKFIAVATASLWPLQICDWRINYLDYSQWHISLKFKAFPSFLCIQRSLSNLQEDADGRTRGWRRAR